MLKPFRYPTKPHRIRIFYEIPSPEGPIKQYIIPNGKYIKAYARQLSSSEQINANALQNASDYEFTIMKREVEQDMLLEFDKGFGIKTYQIGLPDFLEFFKSEISFRASEIATKDYIETRWA